MDGDPARAGVVAPGSGIASGLAAFRYERRLSVTHANFGDEGRTQLTVENRKPLPLVWLDVQDQFPDALPVKGVELEASLAPKRAIFHTVFDVRP
ncbi:MAG: hypothetical protein R2843_02055 [Thermomicrobiales bacterium]